MVDMMEFASEPIVIIYGTLKGEPNTFGSAGDVIMYCWHDVSGIEIWQLF